MPSRGDDHRSPARRRAAVRAALVLLLAEPAAAADLAPAPADLDARAIVEHSVDALRGRTTYLRATMQIESPRLPAPRTVTFRSWDDGPGRRSFIRILAPAKDAGTGYLKRHPTLWTWLPRVERVVRLPPSMMHQSWMGSDFTNDDLVRHSDAVDDYAHRLLGVDSAPADAPDRPAWVVESLPHDDAAVVWARIVAWIDVADAAPQRQEFYAEDGARVRTLRFGDVRTVQGRPVPHRWSAVPDGETGRATTVTVEEIRFDEVLAEDLFTPEHLRGRE
jgi:hypothetical protein